MSNMSKEALLKLGKNIRQLRIENNLTQEKLAELADLHRTYIGGVERGERNISLLNLLKLAHILKVDLSNLVEGVE